MKRALENIPPHYLIGFIFIASAATLLGAYGFEYAGGLAPCQLCYYQRLPYFAAMLLCGTAWLRPGLAHWISAALMAVFLTGAGLGAYHSGVEWHWWAGPASCVAGGSGGSVEDLMAQILAAPIVRCDEIPWSLLGISLAGYNSLISAGLMALAALAFRNGFKDQRHAV